MVSTKEFNIEIGDGFGSFILRVKPTTTVEELEFMLRLRTRQNIHILVNGNHPNRNEQCKSLRNKEIIVQN